MRRSAAIASAVLPLTALIVASCGAPERAASPGPPTTDRPPSSGAPATVVPRAVPVDRARLEALAERYRQSCGAPGAAVGLRTGDGARHLAIAGELAPGIPIRPDSRFLAGSVTKLFVAAVALGMVADGDLALTDTIDRWLPDWPRGDRITIAMLLGHRSGMGDFGNDFGDQLKELVLADLTRTFTYDEVLELVRAVPPVGEPGVAEHYSNANTIVLGAVLQRITGRTLGASIHDRVVSPLALTGTLYGPDDLDAAATIEFHGLFDVAGTGTPVDIGGVPRAAALTVDPAGAGLFSTIPDLLTATHALFATDEVLAADQRAVLSESVSTLTAAELVLDDRFTIAGHGGASPGAQTIVAHDEAHDLTVAVWCNRLDPGEQELLASVAAAREVLLLAVDG